MRKSSAQSASPRHTECQCSNGPERMRSAPAATGATQTEEQDEISIPAERAPGRAPGRDPLTGERHVLVTFRFPARHDSVLQRVFPGAAPVRVVRHELSRLLAVSSSSLVLARGRTELAGTAPLADLRNPATDTLVVDVYSEDGSPFKPPAAGDDLCALLPAPPPKKPVQFVAVKFKVPLQNDNFTRSYGSSFQVREVKKDLAKYFQVEHEVLSVLQDGNAVADDTPLRDLDYDEFGNVDVELRTTDGRRVSVTRLYEPLQTSEVLTVAVPCGGDCGGVVRQLNVELVDAKIRKPYLGGYRNIHSDTEYHHAYTQTQQRKERVSPECKNERDTQTAEEREKLYDTPYSRATQMCGDEVYIPNVADIVVEAGQYETYEEMVARLRHDHFAAIIQRAYRAYRYRLLVWDWLRRCRESIERMKEEERLEKEAFVTKLKRDLITKTLPRTREDFDQLYCMVERWKNAEIARITKLHSKGPKVAEFSLLLDKEIELLRCIEAHRVKVKEDVRKIKNKAFLDEISKPVAWYGIDGGIIEMDTIECQRARKLRDLYNAFCRNDLSPEERMKLLVDLKFALKEFCHPLPEDMTALLDRECELLVRGCGDGELDALRLRTRAAVLRFIKTSELNAGATRRKETAELRGMTEGRLYLCEMCQQCKVFEEFPLHTRSERLAACESCARRGGGGDLSGSTPYRLLLRAVQREERRRRCWGSLAFVMQEKDMAYLVERVWHAQSALGGSGDPMELRLCRWNMKHEWSPWNCLLVTAAEAAAHARLEAPEDTYEEELVRTVKARHALARQHFQQLLAVDRRLLETGTWHKVRARATDHVVAVDAVGSFAERTPP